MNTFISLVLDLFLFDLFLLNLLKGLPTNDSPIQVRLLLFITNFMIHIVSVVPIMVLKNNKKKIFLLYPLSTITVD